MRQRARVIAHTLEAFNAPPPHRDPVRIEADFTEQIVSPRKCAPNMNVVVLAGGATGDALAALLILLEPRDAFKMLQPLPACFISGKSHPSHHNASLLLLRLAAVAQ